MISLFKKASGWLIGLGLLAVLVWGIASLKSPNIPNASSQAEQTEKEPTVYKVALNMNDMAPVSAKIKKGDYVQFDSEDGGQHQIVQSQEGEHGNEALDSGVFGAEEGYRVQFKDSGTFYLKDKFIPNLQISVMVTE